MKPNSLFVANFIGESNFLEGLVADVHGKDLEIELRGGVKVRTAGNGVTKGERAVLVIRPEIFVVESKSAKEPPKNKNLLRGKVEKVTFEGTFIRYVIRLESDDFAVVIKPSLTEKWFDVGASITLSFAPEKVHVFPYPEAGLMDEIAV